MTEQMHEAVRDQYAGAAMSVLLGGVSCCDSGCCDSGCCCCAAGDVRVFGSGRQIETITL